MLVLRIEIWDGGDPDRAREIALAGLANVSNLREVSDYIAVTMHENRQGKIESVEGMISNHRREAGVWRLVEETAKLAQASPVYNEDGSIHSLQNGRRKFKGIPERLLSTIDAVRERMQETVTPRRMRRL